MSGQNTGKVQRHSHPWFLKRLWKGFFFVLVVMFAGLFFQGSQRQPHAQVTDPCAPPVLNLIACENSKPGNPSSEWDITGAGNENIQGFATDISVNQGQTVRFKIDTDAADYRLDIYRMGYYGGLGARKIVTVQPSAPLPQNQPACLTDTATGLVDCGNWAESASWGVPADATSGIYFAKLVRENGAPGASHVVFIVRDDDGSSDILFQTADTTWQAYNQYGGNSLYVGSPAGRAYKVSYNRPFTTRDCCIEDWVFNAEYPMVRWLEANGYNVSYFTGVDSDRRGAEILEHEVFLSVGHDEYWSGAQRANVEAARNAGVNLAFFSGNEVFWKTRWESSIDGSGTSHRTLVSYKETHASAKIDPLPNVWTGTWRDPRFSPPADGGRPENALTGTLFMVNSGTTAIQVPEAQGKHRFWRNTGISTLAPGQVGTLADNTLGYEWDEALDNGFQPDGLARLSSTTVSGVQYLLDFGSTYGMGTATHSLTLYRHSGGALVFGAGTIQWSWGLDGNHDRGGSTPDARMQQATVNLLADMGIQPDTLQADLISATASTDNTAPTSTITSPTNGTTVYVGSPVMVTGTATDTGGGVIASVEVSMDGGATWHPASGRANWSYNWTPGVAGPATLRSRAIDDSGNIGSPSTAVTVTVSSSPPPINCPCSLWNNATLPTVEADPDASAVEVGVKFRSTVSGFITGIRFYKGPGNTGAHIGNLWTSSGTLLSTVTFTNETTTGWQQATLPTSTAITANTTYIVSYHTATGHYALNEPYFESSFTNSPLRALADGEEDGNGVYKSGSSGFPTETFNASNYWVDVVFNTVALPDTTPPSVSSVVPFSGATSISTGTTVTATFNEAMTAATISTTTFELRNPSNTLIPATVTYNATIRKATLTPTSALAQLTTYTAQVKGGASGVKDTAGNAITADFSWSFTTVGPPPDQGPGGPILIIASPTDPFSRYYAEILRTEGFNSFNVLNLSSISATTLNSYDVVILGSMALTASQVTMFTNWVNTGGNLIAMRPDKQLANLLGLTDAATTLSNAYLLVNTSAGPGVGIVNQTIQFKGIADRYTLNGATSVAALYSNATTSTSNPAVTLRSVGSNGGQVAAVTYDLARSVVYLRQGNPAWSGQERDSVPPIRSDDLYFGNASGDPQADWVDFNKVAIPQADEQQRLLANLILQMNLDKKPLPRFWYFPRGLKAVVIMTGDDHANGGTAGRFDQYLSDSPSNCSVTNWECIRGTSYVYPDTALTETQTAAYNAAGFEIGLHVTTGCADYNPSSLESFYSDQLTAWGASYPNLPPPVTNRTHCIAWSDYATQPQVELNHGIRLDTTYYYYPPSWVANRPGLFTGSGMPMRFAALDGTMIDVYQAATQMTDESGQTYPLHINALLDKALGPEGYYGAFTANMHTDFNPSAGSEGSDAIVASALARGVPIIAARQMLTWLDSRNNSSFSGMTWNGNTLSFTVNANTSATGLEAMVPMGVAAGTLTGISRNGSPLPYATKLIKGIQYATFLASAGSYQAIYAVDTTLPTVTGVTPAAGATNVSTNPVVTATFSEAVDASTVNANTVQLRDASTVLVAATVSYDTSTRTATLTPSTPLAFGVTYTATVVGGSSGVKDVAGNALAANFTWSFATLALNCPCSLWNDATTPAVTASGDTSAVELGIKFRSEAAGYITGIRFYKGAGNTGTHVGHLWASDGTLLGSVTFTNETATGWQQASLPSTVAIAANTTYIVSYHAPMGNYAANSAYFGTEYVQVPLHGLASGAAGGNGVYRYGASGFPTDTFNAANYWVDVVFNTVASPVDTTLPTVTGVTPAAGATNVSTNPVVTATFSEAVDASTVNANTVQLRDASTVLVAATVSYDTSTRTATLTPSTPLAFGVTYTATVVGGSSGVKDVAGNALAANFTWSFATLALNCPCSLWNDATTPAVTASGDTSAVELGIKFRSEAAGYITGIRFYKGAGNTGTHVGHLWASDGTLLGSVTFTNETATGWQQASLPSTVAIAANTTYIVSYHAPMGNYAANSAYFGTEYVQVPLHGLASGAAGGNGVYRYGASGFPTDTFNAANYWVDVVFNTVASPVDTTLPTVTGVTPAAGATNVSTNPVVTATFSEAVDASTVNANTVQLRDASTVLVAATVSYDTSTRTATLTPSTPLAFGVTYTATVVGGSSGVKDVAGNALAANFTWSFTTVDTTPPTVTEVTPTSGATNVATNPVVVTATFSEVVDASTVNTNTVQLRNASNILVAATASYDATTFTATLTPSAPLAYNTTYTATVVGGSSGVKDVAGNALAANFTWSFTTVPPPDTTPPAVSSVTPTSGATNVSITTLVTATFSEALNVATINTNTVQLRTATNILVTATVSYDANTHTATLTPSAPLAYNTTYTATVVGGSSGVKDVAGNALAANFTWSFTTVPPPDTTPPAVSSVTPTSGATNISITTLVTATFSEALNVATINTNTVQLRTATNILVTATVSYDANTHTATLTPSAALVNSSTYTATVVGGSSGVKDVADNALAANFTWSFTTTASHGSFTDDSISNFNAGTVATGVYIAENADGEVSLAPTVGAEFSGTTLPSGWSSTSLGSGGTAVVGNGSLTLNGARAGTSATYSSGRSLEFVATFSGAANQKIGFSSSTFSIFDTAWAMFSTQSGGSLSVSSRSNILATTTTQISGNWLGTLRRYRIDWNNNNVVYSIDGNVVATHSRDINTNMKPLALDNTSGGGSVVVDWMRMTPYASSATFLSQVFDAGSTVTWGTASWTSTLPTGTSLSISARRGNTPTPDGTWTSFSTLANSGATVSGNSRYIQYRAVVATTTSGQTPVLQDMTIAY